MAISAVVHVALAAALLLVPLSAPARSPATLDYIRVLIYDAPPPPPPPPPKGSPLMPERPRPRVEPRSLADAEQRNPVLQAPSESAPADRQPDAGPPATEAESYGSPSGSDGGVPEGMEGGVDGGVVGGVTGGVGGGDIGGSGQGPVADFDRPPRILRQTRPRYPQDAFVKKIEGMVLVEFVIDTGGRVATAHVVNSVPLLDAAALDAVRDWIFTPAYRRGVPVASLARAPIAFPIY